MRLTPKSPEVVVPRLVGLMAVDARDTAEARGVLLASPDRPDFLRIAVGHVLRQFPPPGAAVPRGAVVTVWFDSGDGEGGGGVREPGRRGTPPGGLRHELGEPEGPYGALGHP